ncbi:antibiotic biosynthesis monooxygenase [Acidianus sp. HS-5]|uniref:antibiotic biosynthesis monooxygenase family protein n=1 Tax=Acidianus sp. HS-5 TaxID=2886040 RepID=UPI001F1A65C7|nr:antibiotic biosynthesis monooxygenase [Acidianus sp. HS-5]BDC17658.1 antibiotic biosynthesis monooxygenase [Acidianus sp. HS-5]
MINVGLYYRVREGHEKEFEEAFLKVVSILKSSDIGFIDAKLYRRVDDPREYLIYSEWKDLDSFRKFTLSNDYKETTTYGKTILEGRPYHRIYTELKENES